MTQTQQKTAGVAVASMVLGILGLTFLGLLGAVPAIICGHIALSSIGKSDGALGGNGMAIAGLVTGYLALAIAPLLLAIAIPAFMKARTETQRMMCASNMRIIDSARQQWALETGKTSEEPIPAAELEQRLPGGTMPVCPNGGEYEVNDHNGVRCPVHGTVEDIMTSRSQRYPSSRQPAPAW